MVEENEIFKAAKYLTINRDKIFAEKWTVGRVLQEKLMLYVSCPANLQPQYLMYIYVKKISK